MKAQCTGIILSGGENKRFEHINKAFEKIGSTYMLKKIFYLLKKIFKDIIIVSNNPYMYSNFNCYIVKDKYCHRSSLNGIYSGLLYSNTEYSFFTACDMPFIKKSVIEYLINKIEYDKDIIIPKLKLGVEPLLAIYSKKCMKIFKKQIKKNNLKISNIFNKLRTKIISLKEIKKIDNNLLSFYNINTKTELNNVRKILNKKNNL